MNTDVVLTPMQLTGSALYGLIPYGLGTALALAGGRLVKSGEAGFIAMLDVVLGPVWVWLFFSEQPAVEAVIGGTMVLCAVAWYLSKEGNPASEA
jgi:drug/metabolite transporter (DMT)-like permease